ncbi:hypothetical protein BG011_006984 [Mortierella polycephala]|uniref:Myb-like domain-containing protein n=1 Tax=Mortierella polycephala TaxID=41804 RepID=A0A9P6PTW4_9FUNG|nr:hypothetical protein BG011_006984 [Mortierella polycephala]
MQSFDSALDTKTDSATGAGTSTSTSTSTSSIARPFQTLNSSLKRIRLDECEHDSISSRSDSMEKEWGVLDLTELDDNELDTKDSPLNRKRSQKEDGKKTGDNLQKGDMDDIDDMDDFAPSGITANPKIVTMDERPILTEKTLSDRNASSFSSTAATTSTSLTNQLSKTHLSKPYKPPKPARSLSGMEDVFTHAQVRTWSEVRIKTWEHRRTNTEGFYYRFVDPTEGQQNGPWSKQSTGEFMVRLQEWRDRGIRIGTSWGIFSMRVSHKAGYQCSSYYRKLLENKALTDPSYAWENGKLIMVSKSSGGEMAMSGLSERWETDEVKEIEANVNRWIKEYHSNMAGRLTASKAKRVESSGSGSATKSISFGPRNSSIHFRPTIEAPRVKATTASAVPRALSIRLGKQPIDESEMIPAADINDKLAEYSSFMK